MEVTHDMKFQVICEPSRLFSFKLMKWVDIVGYTWNPNMKEPDPKIFKVDTSMELHSKFQATLDDNETLMQTSTSKCVFCLF